MKLNELLKMMWGNYAFDVYVVESKEQFEAEWYNYLYSFDFYVPSWIGTEEEDKEYRDSFKKVFGDCEIAGIESCDGKMKIWIIDENFRKRFGYPKFDNFWRENKES